MRSLWWLGGSREEAWNVEELSTVVGQIFIWLHSLMKHEILNAIIIR